MESSRVCGAKSEACRKLKDSSYSIPVLAAVQSWFDQPLGKTTQTRSRGRENLVSSAFSTAYSALHCLEFVVRVAGPADSLKVWLETQILPLRRSRWTASDLLFQTGHLLGRRPRPRCCTSCNAGPRVETVAALCPGSRHDASQWKLPRHVVRGHQSGASDSRPQRLAAARAATAARALPRTPLWPRCRPPRAAGEAGEAV